MKKKTQVVIIGGGLAGLTSAIHLSKAGISCVLIEKNSYPAHKVCGEYVSNEVLPYLKYLDIDPMQLGAKQIGRFLFSNINGAKLTSSLSMGGFGLSRYTFDKFLFDKAVANGCEYLKDTVINVSFKDDGFAVETNGGFKITASFVIGAFGKRSNLDKSLDREFVNKKSPWLAVKAHYRADFPEDLVTLHNFKGGYCGLSRVEGKAVNLCYLADYDSFKKHKDIEAYQRNVLSLNPYLKEFFANAELIFEKHLTISQLSFDRKKPIVNHILMAGDTAGLIHPLCGNGMAMAIHGAKICSEHIMAYFDKRIPSRTALETSYTKQWSKAFGKRLLTGRRLASMFKNERLAGIALGGLTMVPFIVPQIIKKTHGQPLTVGS